MSRFVIRFAAIASAFYCSCCIANVYDIDQLAIAPSTAPVQYDLDKLQQDVSESVARANRNNAIQVALVYAAALGAGGTSGQCSASGGLVGLCALSDGIGHLVNAIETTSNIIETSKNTSRL